MINLKLAEYNLETGEFERFLELPDFGFYGDYIALSNEFLNDERAKLELEHGFKQTSFSKDEKDPLKRFDGLFDGRTYGGGRFVLITKVNLNGRCYQDGDITNAGILNFSAKETYSCCYSANGFGFLHNFGSQSYYEASELEIKGNLHENPELYEEISVWKRERKKL